MTRRAAADQSTAQRLSSAIKSARNIMRKDRGLSGDNDRLPQLTWLLFLKFLDDHEQECEDQAALRGEPFRPVISAPYRWRDWAAAPRMLSGDDLKAFVDADQATRPDGGRGLGLFAYLRSIGGEDDRRNVVAQVFRGTFNRMQSGYLLGDVIDQVSTVDFHQSETISTLGFLYETMLREMRDASGDSGEFYTPRPVVKLMVELLDPQLGEVVLDPAAGTGGFLAEAFEHLRRQVHTIDEQRMVQTHSLRGIEPKPLPYLLCQMNLLLHGLEVPSVDASNALNVHLGEIGESGRVDVILTNPPFGGEEERSILLNFPKDRQTSETSLLFLQVIMRRLRRTTPGRAAVVAPNGILFAGGVATAIKRDLLTDFRLHTIVRLPNGVFAPYTQIPTNILFFEYGGPTEEVWYYEHPLPEGRKSYSKTQPLRSEEFAPLLAWWQDRQEGPHAWRVSAAEIAAAGYNLDRKNPHAAANEDSRTPDEILDGILEREQEILRLLGEVREILAARP